MTRAATAHRSTLAALACAAALAVDARADDATLDLAPTNVAHALLDEPALAEPDPSWSLGVGAHVGGLVGQVGFPMFGPSLAVSARARVGWFAVEPRLERAMPQLLVIAFPYTQVGAPLLLEVPVWVLRPYVGAGPTFAVGRLIGHVGSPPLSIPGAEGVAGCGVALLPHVEARVQARVAGGVVLQAPGTPFWMGGMTASLALSL